MATESIILNEKLDIGKVTPQSIARIAPENLHPDFLDQVAGQLEVEMRDLKYLEDIEVKEAFLKWNKKYTEIINGGVGRQEVTEVSNIA